MSQKDALVQLRSKLDTLVGALWTLEAAIGEGGAAGMAPWPDILAKYQNVLTFTQSFALSLVPPPPPADYTHGTDLQRSRRRQEYNDAWTRTLAGSSVHPVKIPEEPEALGTFLSLLVTRQNPDIEEHLESLRAKSLKKDPTEEGAAAEKETPEEQVARLTTEIKTHDASVAKALEHTEKILEEAGPYAWRIRLDLDEGQDALDQQDGEDEEEEGGGGEGGDEDMEFEEHGDATNNIDFGQLPEDLDGDDDGMVVL